MRQLFSTLRHRPAPLIGVFVALIAAASIVTWAFSVGEAGGNSTVPAQRLAAATVVVTGHQDVTLSGGSGQDSTTVVPLTSYRRVPIALATTLGKLPGVRAAVADESVPVALELPHGRVAAGTVAEPLTAYGWQSAALTPFRLTSGQAPQSLHEIVLSRNVARSAALQVGDHVRLAGRPLPPFTVVGIAAATTGDPAGVGTVFFSVPEAAVLYGHPRQADLIGIIGRTGVSSAELGARVRAAVAGQNFSVVQGGSRGMAEEVGAASDLSNLSELALAGGIDIVLISLFVAASTVAFSVAERARTMALLRAVGATPGQVRRVVMTELAALGVIAGLVAYFPGTWLASLSVRGLATHELVPSSIHAWTSPIELFPSIGAAVVVAEVAGFFAARRASRIRPAAALEEATIERRVPRPVRLILGIAAIGGGVALSVFALQQPDAFQQLTEAQLVLLTFMAGVALLGPYLMTVAERILHLPLAIVGRAPGRLAGADVRARSRRTAAAAVAIALPVCFAGAITTVDATQIHAATTQGQQRLRATEVVSAPGPGLDPSVLGVIRSAPGVVGAVGLVPTTVYLGPLGGPIESEAVTPGPLGSVLNLKVTSGSLSHFGPGDVALSTLAAGKGAMDVHVGQTITAYLADGVPYRAQVTAVFSRDAGFADAVIPTSASGGGHLGSNSLAEVLVAGSDRTGPAAPRSGVASLSARYPGLQAVSRSVANAQYELENSQSSYANNLLLSLVGLLAGLALVNTLVLVTLQGREELMLLRRVGATGRQLLAMTAFRMATVVLVGLVLGVVAQIPAVVAVSKALAGTWVPYASASSVAVIVGLVVLLAGVATFGPTLRMLRRDRVG